MVVLCALLAPGCGDDAAATPGGGVTTTPVTVPGEITAFIPGVPGGAVPAVEVCVHGHAGIPCVNTDAAGMFSLPGVPSEVEVTLTLAATGYLPIAVPLLLPEGEAVLPLRSDLVPEAAAEAFATATGLTYPLGQTGVISFTVTSAEGNRPGMVGVAVTIEGDATAGVHYVDEGEVPDATATGTSARGWGVVGSLPASEVELRFTLAGSTCETIVWGWPGAAGTVAVPVLPGHMTNAMARCTTP